jgi:tetratricopeptide (TPR) repeat protein
MGSVRSGDRAGSERELATLHCLRQALVDRGDGYGANQVQIQITTIQAWSYLAEGKAEAARLSMEEAARMEYGTSKHPVTPGEVLPAGELLGDLLMATGRASQALEAYRFDLGQHPNRFNGLYGAATAARSIGDENTALQYFEMMLAQAHPSNDERKEIREAREFLRKKKAG